MTLPAPTFMDPRVAGRALAASLRDPRAPLTIADAATASGLALRDAERGLQWLTSEYRGHLRVTEAGDLLFLFPYGFDKPWETRDKVDRALAAALRGAVGVGRFVVRAWLMIVLVAYVALFFAILIGMTFARQSDSDSRRGGLPGGALIYVLFRVLADALFWTFHPFSPFAYGGYGYGSAWGEERVAPRSRAREVRGAKDETPFYEKVNRFFFGPTPPAEDPHAMERKILGELRAQKGRIGLADVMKVTGLPREKADPMMARLMLDYDGDVDVSDDGGIFYRFETMRLTARDGRGGPNGTDGTDAKDGRAGLAGTDRRPRPAWEDLRRMLPLTGNSIGANVLITALNVFNLVMSVVALDENITLAKLPYLFSRIPLAELPFDGTPVVLGIVPLVFSIALFALPIGRAIARPIKAKRIAKENGRLGMLREILTRIDSKAPLTESALVDAWTRTAGAPPEPEELTQRVVELGGGVEIEESTGEVRYRFVDLETEAAALEAEREQASDEEKKIGKVVFATDDGESGETGTERANRS